MRKILLFALLFSCGVDENSSVDIVGGQRVSHKPWFVHLGNCGGSLIKPRWVVTAAHCVSNPNKQRIAKIGFYKKGDPKHGGKPLETIKSKRIILHPKWKSGRYDLALIELERRSKFKPIEMYEGRNPPDGYRLQTYGFGNTSYQGSGPKSLLGTVLVFNEKATANARPQIMRLSEKGAATCHGDSGGPLIYNALYSDNQNTNVRPQLIATTTFTVDKCRVGGLMGFTRLDLNWIRKVTK